VKASINRLMKYTLATANIIFCMMNVASKVNFYKNSQPGMIVCDEAYKAIEILILLLLAFYNPKI
jgi:hypothetical protein